MFINVDINFPSEFSCIQTAGQTAGGTLVIKLNQGGMEFDNKKIQDTAAKSEATVAEKEKSVETKLPGVISSRK